MNAKDLKLELISEYITQKPRLTVKRMLDFETKREFHLTPIFNNYNFNLEKKFINHSTVIRPQFALAGFTNNFVEEAIVILGRTESEFLKNFNKEEQVEKVQALAKFNIPCVIITNNNEHNNTEMFPTDIIEVFLQNDIPVFKVNLPTPVFFYRVMDLLDDIFCPKSTIHGNLIEVFGVGILILGESGIGKSELTLDLLEKGHRLVADDLVILMRKWGHKVFGFSNNRTKTWIEIRGAGIFDVTQMFGANCFSILTEVDNIVYLYSNEKMYETIFNFLQFYTKNKKIDIDLDDLSEDKLYEYFSKIPDSELSDFNLKIFKRLLLYPMNSRLLGGSYPCTIFDVPKELNPINVQSAKDISVIVEAIASRTNSRKIGFLIPAEKYSEFKSSPENFFLPPNWVLDT